MILVSKKNDDCVKIVTLLAKSTPDLLKLTWIGPCAGHVHLDAGYTFL